MRVSWVALLALGAALVFDVGAAYAQDDDGSSAEAANRRPARAVALGELLDLVVQQNPDLVRAEVDLAVAEGGRLAADGLDDWRLTASGMWLTRRSEFVETNPFQQTAEDTLTVSGELVRPLASGGEVGLRLAGGFSDVTFVFLGQDDMGAPLEQSLSGSTIATSLTARISHPLLGGRGEWVARAQRRQSALERDRVSLARRATANDAVRSVVRAYWELALAIRTVGIAEQSLELAREQLRLTRIGIERKVQAPTEALAIEQAMAVREQALLAAEIEVSSRSLALRRLVGMEIGPGEVLLTTRDTPAVDGGGFDLDQALRHLRERNPRLAFSRAAIAVRAVDVEVAADALRPRLDIAASVGPDASATGVGDTLERFALWKSFSAGATLTYSQTLGKRGARGTHRQALEQARGARIDAATLERDLAAEVVNTVNRVRLSDKQVAVSEVAIRLAEANLESEKVLAAAGGTRAFDVLARQDELAAARLQRETAVVAYKLAVADLEWLTGALLERHGIDLR